MKSEKMGFALLLALAFTSYMIISSAMAPKPVFASIEGREYPAPDKVSAPPEIPKQNSIEYLLGDAEARRQLALETARLQAAVDKRRAEEVAKRLQSMAPVPNDFPETEAMEALLLAEDYSGVHWEVLDATHRQETRAGKFLGHCRPWQVMSRGQYAAFLKICKVTGRDPKQQVCSSKGAIGQMQFLPKTWVAEGKDGNGDGVIDPWCPQDAIISAGQFLAKHGYETNPDKAIAYYNGGNNRGPAVKRYVAEVKARAAKAASQSRKKDH
ncbi:MAG: hypothetical protein A3J65_03025 [Candidatus Buchananbacteria bacterium RIFCSPHIGHO2_02_FULL_45_11b]|uniref:Transglycosylase SLT domain-containing protein n=2 Tax=Candidatus Buchananiibacteriota TaxID=1817903 RepID=A0A1G1YEK8_9BACT|nr:MAG: hypothetical protein A3J65_03025 [Candidatus Buchananbacteria bacterium RIFCSPHIGHO2_02_FULL_45_11b]OGY55844.1 MAG: hypothetical protein A3H67_01550 [Candidatus Buchananbacteria bacterium RIFCSPLOWO2_02_FULL_46_11b]